MFDDDIYAGLTGSRDLLPEHPRQTRRALDAALRQRQFWFEGKSFDWCGNLNGHNEDELDKTGDYIFTGDAMDVDVDCEEGHD